MRCQTAASKNKICAAEILSGSLNYSGFDAELKAS